jgi:hypothetical protein
VVFESSGSLKRILMVFAWALISGFLLKVGVKIVPRVFYVDKFIEGQNHFFFPEITGQAGRCDLYQLWWNGVPGTSGRGYNIGATGWHNGPEEDNESQYKKRKKKRFPHAGTNLEHLFSKCLSHL